MVCTSCRCIYLTFTSTWKLFYWETSKDLWWWWQFALPIGINQKCNFFFANEKIFSNETILYRRHSVFFFYFALSSLSGTLPMILKMLKKKITYCSFSRENFQNSHSAGSGISLMRNILPIDNRMQRGMDCLKIDFFGLFFIFNPHHRYRLFDFLFINSHFSMRLPFVLKHSNPSPVFLCSYYPYPHFSHSS